MYSFDEKQYLLLKQRKEKVYEKKNYSGIALCSANSLRQGIKTGLRQGT